MKLVFISIGIFFICLGVAMAGEPVSMTLGHDSSYVMSQSTISVSSTSVTTVPAAQNYRKAEFDAVGGSAIIYFRVDGSTDSIPTVGQSIAAGGRREIETNAAIHLQLGAGETAETIRLLDRIK